MKNFDNELLINPSYLQLQDLSIKLMTDYG